MRLVATMALFQHAWLRTGGVGGCGDSSYRLRLGQRKWGQRRASLFGAYGGIRDGSKFVFGRFQYVGLITAIGTTLVVFLVSLGIVHWYWSPEEYEDIGFTLQELIRDVLNPFVIGAVFVTTWLLFVSGALLGTALQIWAHERGRVG